MKYGIGVLVVCSNTLISELLGSALSMHPLFRVLPSASSEGEVLTSLLSQSVQVVLIDGDGNGSAQAGIDMLSLIRREAPQARTIMLLEHRDRDYVVDCFRNGANGVFWKKNSDFKLLCKCVECVCKGQFWASSEELGWVIDALELTNKFQSAVRVVNANGENLLSKREEDVVRLLMNGLTNREIAQSLQLSEHTVKNYLFRIFDKVGVGSRTELLVYALNAGISDSPPQPISMPSGR